LNGPDPVEARLLAVGWNDHWAARSADGRAAGLQVGRVVRHDGSALLLTTAADAGNVQLPLSPALDPAPVVGDWVLHDEVTVRAVLPRESLLRRRGAHGEVEQPVAANIDTVLVVHGGDRPVSAGRVQRFAALAWDAGAVPVLVLAKSDLVEDPEATIEELLSGERRMEAVITSTVHGTGLDQVHELVSGRTVVVVGESGVGKSTLVNALAGDEVAAVGEVREGDRKGRHTTTSRQLHVLPDGGCLIDTPGVRAIGLWVDPEAVAETFSDIDELATDCRFSDCGHETEPGCAVRAAVESGTLAVARVESWRRLQDEADATERHLEETTWRRKGRPRR
jgi:ribosome biogenesis GTPase / thiamine phosphate phosphatase